MIQLQDFLKITDKLKAKWGSQLHNHIDFCGLEPVSGSFRFESTPVNSVTFAATGGDAVHFSLLIDINELNGPQPVVMTVPMISKNIVLADTLDEFLGLGLLNGWFRLEKLAYNSNKTIDYYSSKDESLSIEKRNFLTFIQEDLNVKHVPLTKERLELLATQYNDKVIIQTK